MELAVIKTGGKQYKVSVGDKIKIEKIANEVGTLVTFTDVLLFGTDKDIIIGDPIVKDVIVEGKVLLQDRHDKVWGLKHKSKKRYKMKFGHRQSFTEIEIIKISTK